MATVNARLAPTGEASTAAYLRLRALIVDGVLAPGSPLIESEVAARLGVSRTPLRAALLRLEQEGFVGRSETRARGLRAIVAPLTVRDLEEVFLMVGALEALAARQLAGDDAARRAEVAGVLEETDAKMRAALVRRPPDLRAAQDAHARFHRICPEAVAGPRLRTEIETLAPQAERYAQAYGVATMYAIDQLAAGHAAIVAALRSGDAEAAEQATIADWRVAADRHREMMTILGERGNW